MGVNGDWEGFGACGWAVYVGFGWWCDSGFVVVCVVLVIVGL